LVLFGSSIQNAVNLRKINPNRWEKPDGEYYMAYIQISGEAGTAI
jgi:hypothetical protein